MSGRLLRWTTVPLAIAVFLVLLLIGLKLVQPESGNNTKQDVQSFSVPGLRSVAISSDGTRGLFGGYGDLRLWDLVQCREIRQLAGGKGLAESVALSPDGTTGLASVNERMGLWDLVTGQLLRTFGEIRTLGDRGARIHAVAFSADGLFALSGSDAGSMRLWDVQSGKELLLFDEGHSGSVYRVALSPDGRRAFSSSSDGTARLWDVATGEELFSFPAMDNLVFSPDGRRVAATDAFSIHVWEVENGRELHSFKFEERDAAASEWWRRGLGVSFSPDGRQVLGGHVLITFLKSDEDKEPRDEMEESGPVPITLSFAVRAWDVETGLELNRVEKLLEAKASSRFRMPHIAIPADGNHALIWSHDGQVWLWHF